MCPNGPSGVPIAHEKLSQMKNPVARADLIISRRRSWRLVVRAFHRTAAVKMIPPHAPAARVYVLRTVSVMFGGDECGEAYVK